MWMWKIEIEADERAATTHYDVSVGCAEVNEFSLWHTVIEFLNFLISFLHYTPPKFMSIFA